MISKLNFGIKLRHLIALGILLFLSACGEPAAIDTPFASATSAEYNATMKKLEGQLTAVDYTKLKHSINYLNMKSTEFSSLDAFRQSLNGSTPAEIIKRVEAMKAAKLKPEPE